MQLYSATPVTDKPQGKSLSSEKNKVTPAVKKSDKASNKVPAKSFKNKQELIDFVKHQTNYELPNEDSTLNRNRNRLYTKIDRLHHNSVLSTLNYWGIKYNEHLGGYYWIDLKNGDKAPATNKENAVKPAKQTAIAKGTPATDKFINHTADLISNRQTGKPIGKDEEFSDMYLAARDENKGNTDMLSSLHNIAVKIAAMQNTRAQESSYSLDQSDIAKNIQDIRDMQKGTVSKAKQEKLAKAKNGTTVEKKDYRLVDKAKTISGISGVPEKEIKKMIVPYEANNAAEARKYANKFLGKILTNKNYGISGVVSISNFRKMISESSLLKSSFPSVHMTAVANVDTLFKKAEFDVTQQDRDNDTNIKLIHYMYTSMLYRNKAYRIKLVVKELKNPNENNSIYAVEALDVEKPTWKQDIADTVNNNSPMVPPQVGAYILDAKNRKINHPNNPVPNVTAADLSASVKGAAVETIRDGVFSLNFTNGNKIIVDTTVDYIPMDSDKVLKDYGHRPTENDMAVGVTQVISGQRFIRLVSGMSGIKTFNHEIFENAFMNMTRTERSILLKDYGSKEVAADRYADFLMKRMGALTKRSTTIFQKTKDFFSNIRAKLFGKKSEDIFRDIENGNILNREIIPEDTENYRIVKRPSEMTKEPEQETTKASADLEYVPPAEPPKAAPDESGNVPTPKAQTIWQKFADDHGLDRVVDRSEEKLITSYSEIISTDNAINSEKDKQIVILKDTIVAKDKAHATEMKKAEAKGWVRTILVGIAAGTFGYLVAK